MRRVFISGLLLAALAAAASADNIGPQVGVIEIYGNRRVSTQKIRAALGIKEGSPFPASKGNAEEKLDQISGIVASRLQAACCVQGKMVLYVGIEEKDSPHFEFRPEPSGEAKVPDELSRAYDEFLDTVNQSIRLAQTSESLGNGYSLMQNSGARQRQEAFIPLVAKYLDNLHEVIRESNDPDQRAMAAYVLQYGPRDARSTPKILNDLQYALQDVDDTVRDNAMRSLTAMYVGGKTHPEQGIKIQPTWFVELLNSIVWSDRHNASVALVEMTEDRNAETLALIKDRALHSVVEMAQWHDLGNALPAFILTGRLAGVDEKEIQSAWVNQDHALFIKSALTPGKKKRR